MQFLSIVLFAWGNSESVSLKNFEVWILTGTENITANHATVRELNMDLQERFDELSMTKAKHKCPFKYQVPQYSNSNIHYMQSQSDRTYKSFNCETVSHVIS